jgi:hypothetical protein
LYKKISITKKEQKEIEERTGATNRRQGSKDGGRKGERERRRDRKKEREKESWESARK